MIKYILRATWLCIKPVTSAGREQDSCITSIHILQLYRYDKDRPLWLKIWREFFLSFNLTFSIYLLIVPSCFFFLLWTLILKNCPLKHYKIKTSESISILTYRWHFLQHIIENYNDKKINHYFFSAKKLIYDKEYRKPHPVMTVIPDPHPRLASACPCR